MIDAQRAPTALPSVGVRNFSICSKFLYEEDMRLGATTYSQEYYAALQVIESCRYSKADLWTLVGRVYHPTENQARSNFKRVWVKRGEGPPFLTGRQLFFFRPDQNKFIARKMKKLDELLVPEGTLLLTRSGKTGYPVLVNKRLSQFALTDDAIRIFPGDEPIGFIYSFLASTIGRPLLTKSEYGSTVSHLEAKHVKALPVPLVPKQIRRSIHNKIIRAYKVRDEANALLDAADKALHELIGISGFDVEDIEYLGSEAEARAFAISSAELGDRLDAAHHVPITRSAVHKLSHGKFDLVRIGERVKKVYVAPRFARIYVNPRFGTPLLQGSHLPLISPHDLKYISNTETVKMDRWIIRRGWVLVTCSGTIGRVAVSTTEQDGWAASQHILRIIPRDRVSHPGFLAAFLATSFGQHQLNSKIYGGLVGELTEADTEQVWIPDVPYDEQEVIGNLVVRAFEMRDEANLLEKEAIGELEFAITERNAEDKGDAEIAYKRLDEIYAAPDKVVRGAALERKMKHWLS